MPEQPLADTMARGSEDGIRIAVYASRWEEYLRTVRYLRCFGKVYPPTARLIMLSLIGHVSDAAQLSHDTGACLYAINENLNKLTKQGILVRREFHVGRTKHRLYRINPNAPYWNAV